MINQTTAIATVLLVALCFLIPRKYLLLPFILCACFVPADQCIILADMNFFIVQILVIACILRLWLRGEIRSVNWNGFDKIVLMFAIVGTVVYIVHWQQWRVVIFKCGRLLEMLGLYWVFRQSILSWATVRFAFTILALCSLIMAPFVAYEWATGNNPFVILGRVTTDVRQGNYRCQASFPHGIIAGLFWATLVPVFVGFAKQNKYKLLFWSAVATSIFIVVATASSTPIITLLIVPIMLCGYKWRKHTGSAGWCLLALLTALHIVMKGPIWHLISRVSVVKGSTGWHRYNLIDQAIKHFNEWAVIGCRSTAHWGYGLLDITNQYIAEGVKGGLITLVIFLLMLYMALRTVLYLSLEDSERKHHFLLWCLFVVIIAHCVAFFGVTYFGQINIVWYMMLAIVGWLYQSKKIMRVRHYAGEI